MKLDWKLPENSYAFKDIEGKELCKDGDRCALLTSGRSEFNIVQPDPNLCPTMRMDTFIQPATASRPRYKDGWLHFDQVDDFMKKVGP